MQGDEKTILLKNYFTKGIGEAPIFDSLSLPPFLFSRKVRPIYSLNGRQVTDSRNLTKYGCKPFTDLRDVESFVSTPTILQMI